MCHFRSPSSLWDSVVKHPSCPSTHSIALKTQTQITLLKRWRSAVWLCRNDPSFLWKQTASIWVTFALLAAKIEAVFTIFTTVNPAESVLLWENTAVFSALRINRITNFPPNEACPHILIDFVPMPWATAVQSFYRKGVVEVSNMAWGILLWLVMMTEPEKII